MSASEESNQKQTIESCLCSNHHNNKFECPSSHLTRPCKKFFALTIASFILINIQQLTCQLAPLPTRLYPTLGSPIIQTPNISPIQPLTPINSNIPSSRM